MKKPTIISKVVVLFRTENKKNNSLTSLMKRNKSIKLHVNVHVVVFVLNS